MTSGDQGLRYGSVACPCPARELLAGCADVAFVRRLLASMTEWTGDRQVAEEVGRIRAEVGIRLPKALIAATAVVHGLTLHPRNVRDFKGVPGLRLRGSRWLIRSAR